MPLAMARPTRRKGSSKHQFRKRVPLDVLRKARGQPMAFRLPAAEGGQEVIVTTRVSAEITFSLRTDDDDLGKERQAAVLAQFGEFCRRVRQGPLTLSHKQIVALAGEWYREWIAELEDEPGSPAVWQRWLRILESVAANGRLVEQVGPVVDEFLSGRQLIVDEGSRERLCIAFHDAMMKAGDTLRRYAAGDYSPDPNAQAFPAWRGHEPVASSNGATPLTFDGLFDRWRRETKPAASTVTTYKGYLKHFKKHLGHNDPRRVTKADVIAFKDKLVDRGLKPKGIKDGHLAALKAIFNYAVRNELLPHNPAVGVTVSRKAAPGEGMLPYTDEEVARLLALADQEVSPARRWLPWLLAATGARVGELAQLWGRRVIEPEDGIAFMKIAPAEDGGSLKNEGSERDLPIHPALIRRGFLQFVRQRGNGPLFYGSSGKRTAKGDDDGRRHASKGVTNRLAEWVRAQGFTDKRKAPSHAFRHWFKTKAMDLGVQERVVDLIQGQTSERSVADRYRHVSLEMMAKAIRRIPVPPSSAKKLRRPSSGAAAPPWASGS